MEDIKKLLEQNETHLSSSSDGNNSDSMSSIWRSKYNSEDVFYSNHNLFEMKCLNSITTKKRNGEKRLPTRRPDPNVYNRNALLARENRRKKKVYLETIEKELLAARKANRDLAKALKRQIRIAQRLEKEKNNFESLVSSRSQMMTIANALNCNEISESDESPFSTTVINENFTSTYVRDRTSTRSTSSGLQDADTLSIEFDSPSDGSVTAPIESSFCDISSFDLCTLPDFFTDLDNCTDSSLPTTSTAWDDIWGDKDYNIDDIISTDITILPTTNHMQNFHDDHRYVSTSKIISIKNLEQKSESSVYIDVEGDCSHVGKFCSICTSNPTCGTPPLQLLSEQH